MMLLNTPAPSLPIGSILAYAGLLADIPTGWAICDGTNGTPDLTDSFVMGGSHAQIGNTGGANSVTPSGSVSVNNHTLSQSQMPAHNHVSGGVQHTNYYSLYGNYSPGYVPRYLDGGGSTSSSESPYTSTVGSSAAHNHGASLSLNSQDNKPKYYKTAYIMRVS